MAVFELLPGALRLVSITPGDRTPAETLALTEASLGGGACAVLLRERALEPTALLSLAHDLSALCRLAGALLLVSNDVELALACAASGVHLGHGGPAVDVVRRTAPGLLVGRSAHWPPGPEDRAADYVTLSPVASTPHSWPRPLLSAEQLCCAVADPALGPVLALGGLDVESIGALPANVAGVAVLRALSQAVDPRVAAARLLQAFEQRGQPATAYAP